MHIREKETKWSAGTWSKKVPAKTGQTRLGFQQ